MEYEKFLSSFCDYARTFSIVRKKKYFIVFYIHNQNRICMRNFFRTVDQTRTLKRVLWKCAACSNECSDKNSKIVALCKKALICREIATRVRLVCRANVHKYFIAHCYDVNRLLLWAITHRNLEQYSYTCLTLRTLNISVIFIDDLVVRIVAT